MKYISDIYKKDEINMLKKQNKSNKDIDKLTEINKFIIKLAF